MGGGFGLRAPEAEDLEGQVTRLRNEARRIAWA